MSNPQLPELPDVTTLIEADFSEVNLRLADFGGTGSDPYSQQTIIPEPVPLTAEQRFYRDHGESPSNRQNVTRAVLGLVAAATATAGYVVSETQPATPTLVALAAVGVAAGICVGVKKDPQDSERAETTRWRERVTSTRIPKIAAVLGVGAVVVYGASRVNLTSGDDTEVASASRNSSQNNSEVTAPNNVWAVRTGRRSVQLHIPNNPGCRNGVAKIHAGQGLFHAAKHVVKPNYPVTLVFDPVKYGPKVAAVHAGDKVSVICDNRIPKVKKYKS